MEFYLFKKEGILDDKTKKNIFNIFKKLNNIAKRKYNIDHVVDNNIIPKNIKNMIKLDKNRLGLKPEKGQNQWSR
jgi:hypothetical protein